MRTLFQLSLLFLTVFFCSCESNTEKKQSEVQQSGAPKGADSTQIAKNERLSYAESYNRALTLWKTTYQEKDIKTSLGNAHVIMCGRADAPPLVLLHGMNASSTMWYPNIHALSEKFRIYAIDFLLEPGKSLCQGEVNSTDAIVKWYYEIFDILQLKKFSILGASRGGWLAVNIALNQPSRVNKIALLSPAQTFIWIKPVPRVISNITYSISPKRKKLRSVLETMTFNVDNINQLYINQYYIATKEATTNKCIMQMTPFSDNELKSLRMPVLVLIGDDDIINNRSSLKKAKRLIPNVQAEIIKDAGHFLSIDQAEIINKKVIDFLTAGAVSVRR